MPRNRVSAVLGSSVPRPRPQPFPSRSRSTLRRRAVVGVLVLLSLVLITISFRAGSGGPVHILATGHAALPALPHYYGLVCHLAAASRANFGRPYMARYRRPHADGPLRDFPGSDARQLWSRAVRTNYVQQIRRVSAFAT